MENSSLLKVENYKKKRKKLFDDHRPLMVRTKQTHRKSTGGKAPRLIQTNRIQRIQF